MENGESKMKIVHIKESFDPIKESLNSDNLESPIDVMKILETLNKEDIINNKISFGTESFKLIIDEVKKRSKDKNISEKEREKWMALYSALAFS